MRPNRLGTLLALTLSAALIACGGGDDGGGGNADGGGGDITPMGDHTQYVLSEVNLPANSGESSALGFDVDGDGRTENALGGLLATLALTGGIEFQDSIDEAVATGQVLVLANLQATSLMAATNVGFWIFLGANPTPAACTDPMDPMTCGQHLSGTGSFEISTTSPTDGLLGGQIVGGQFSGGPGTVTIQIALSEGANLPLTLVGARTEFDAAANGLSNARLGGAITADDINNDVIPAVATLVADLVSRDCMGAFPDCCTVGSTGATLITFFDEDDSCTVTLTEIQENSLVSSTLGNPDLDLFDETGAYNPRQDGVNDSLSLALAFSAVSGTFPLPADL